MFQNEYDIDLAHKEVVAYRLLDYKTEMSDF